MQVIARVSPLCEQPLVFVKSEVVMPEVRQVRRQARGEQRMTGILDAAAVVFAETGYDGATTNAIAAQAGISPGSLYQFFRNKEAIAEALAGRFLAEMGEAHASAFDTSDIAEASLHELLDRVVDPLVAFNVENPGLKTLFANTDMPPALAEATRPLRDAVTGKVEAILKVRAPRLSGVELSLGAGVAVHILKALIAPIVEATGKERAALIAELKKVLYGYLAPIVDKR
jgi:AcrR family transcriptional regulator